MIDAYYKSFLGSKVIPTLCDQYKNIDIRAIYAKNKDNPQWRCAFLKVYFTKDSKEVIEDIHRKKHELLSINNSNLQFQSECKDITGVEKLLKEINNMSITINGIKATLHPYSQNLFGSTTKLSINNGVLELYIIGSKLENYPHTFISIESTETPADVLTFLDFNFKDQAYGNLDIEIETFLDTNSINSSNRNGIITFPIYFKKLELDSNEQFNHITKFEIHESLLPHCRLSVSSLKDNKIVTRIDGNNLERRQHVDRIIIYVSRQNVNKEILSFVLS